MYEILSKRFLSGLAIACAATLAFSPVHARAAPFFILDMQVSQYLLVGIGVGSSCIAYTYDANGNRTLQTITTIGATPVAWNSKPYGCFLWSAS